MRAALLLVVLALAGCETSAVWYATHPDKKVVQVDGRDINVVPRAKNAFDAWGGDDGTVSIAPITKARQIRAIEMASGCKVQSAEYAPASGMLQALVIC